MKKLAINQKAASIKINNEACHVLDGVSAQKQTQSHDM